MGKCAWAMIMPNFRNLRRHEISFEYKSLILNFPSFVRPAGRAAASGIRDPLRSDYPGLIQYIKPSQVDRALTRMLIFYI
jgi:hypothetical protein